MKRLMVLDSVRGTEIFRVKEDVEAYVYGIGLLVFLTAMVILPFWLVGWN
jgi:hypothetical protein